MLLQQGCGITRGGFTAGLWDYIRCFYSWAVGLQEAFLHLDCGITVGVFTAGLWDYRRSFTAELLD